MFDGVADQFHHHLVATRAVAAAAPSSSPSSPSLPLHHLPIAAAIFPGFDLYPSSASSSSSSQQHRPHHLELQQPVPIPEFLHHPLHHHRHTTPRNISTEKENADEGDDELACMKLMPPPGGEEDYPWTDEEVFALVRIRSGIENWFPEATWENVSRKLEELGFKRSPEKCKEKFDEESRLFDGNNDGGGGNSYGTNDYRILSELEEICRGDRSRNPRDPHIESGLNEMGDRPEGETVGIRDSEEKRDCGQEDALRQRERTKRKRRHQKFEMFKRFCEKVVEKLMVQQEEMHNKLLYDLVKMDEEMIAREEEQKKREMDRIKKELDTRANEQAMAGDRQATVIELLMKFASSSPDHDVPFPIDKQQIEGGDCQPSSSAPSTSSQPPQTETRILKSSKHSLQGQKADKNPNGNQQPQGEEQESGRKRWPREEVKALINLRSGMIENRQTGETPVWERISRGMGELGYRRSAKRCKEKWENMNKYFRKTRDAGKKRSGESRTCPYFHQLSSLYGNHPDGDS